MYEKKKVFIVAKTYPIPSETYMELVCTGGILEDGSFVRLYPIDYRYRSYSQWYHKYQWIEVEIEKNQKDTRKESFRPKPDGEIITIGNPIGTENKWLERKRIVLKHASVSLEELYQKRETDNTSMGIFKPKSIDDFIIEKDTEEWSPKQLRILKQINLFEKNRKPLTKIPFKFKYKFHCNNPDCKGHKMMIEDWEVGALYLNEMNRHGDKKKAIENVKNNFFYKACNSDRETYFYVGTLHQYHHMNKWVIVGLFYPPKEEKSLFD